MRQCKWLMLLVWALAAVDAEHAAPQKTDAETDKELSALFTFEQAQTRIGQIKVALFGYRDLTDIVCMKSNLATDYGIQVIHQTNVPEDAEIVVKMRGKDLRACRRIGWEEQYIGFNNLVTFMEGYVRFQEYEKMKSRLEVLQLKDAPASEIEVLRQCINHTRSELAEGYLGEEDWAD